MPTITQALTRKALALLAVATLPVATAAAGSNDAWTALEQLQPGREVSITFRDGAETHGWVIKADESSLHYFRTTAKRSANVQKAMDATRSQWPGLLDGKSITIDAVRLSVAGIYDGDRKVVDHVAVPRDDIRAITTPSYAVATTILGAVGGFIAAGIVASHTEYPGKAAAFAIVFGMPTAGGIAGYYAGRGRALYRAPDEAKAEAPLDHAAIQRILAGLPPSLRGTIGGPKESSAAGR